MSASAQSGPEQHPPSAPGRTPSATLPFPDPPGQPPPPPPVPRPNPETDEDEDEFVLYDYATPAFRIRESAIQAAESEVLLKGEEAYETGEDLTGAAFCGCSTCEARLVAAFWIAWTVDAIRSGDLLMGDAATTAEPHQTG